MSTITNPAVTFMQLTKMANAWFWYWFSSTIDLIAKKPKGIFVLLDEESVFPKATDNSFMEKLQKNHEGKHLKFSKPMLSSELIFQIHYAGTVEYNTTNWLEKNHDPLKHNLEQTIKASEIPSLYKFFVPTPLTKQTHTSFVALRGTCSTNK